MQQMKLKQSQIAEMRSKLLDQQCGKCAACGGEITSDPVLDHCHATGHIRGVLHRACNAAEGKLTNIAKSTGKNIYIVDLVRGLEAYWSNDYSSNPLHPTFKTQDDKEIRKLKSAMKKAKTETTKQKHAERIREIKKSQLKVVAL